MKSWLDLNFFLGIPASRWCYALAATAVIYLVLSTTIRVAVKRLDAWSSRTSTWVDDALVDVLRSTRAFLLLAAATLAGTQFLALPEIWGSRIDKLWFLVVGIQVALWLNRSVGLWTHHRVRATLAQNPVLTTMTAWVLRAVLWSILLLAVLANMGVNITAFVASLGVGGVAVALAVQSILSDLFASLAIGLDKPFEIGDFITFGDVAGSVEYIGLKTTRIRSISGQEIICSNTALLKNVINNYKRMTERRIVFTFGLRYDATPEQLRRVPERVRAVIEAAGATRFDRAHFKGFGASDLTFEVVYYVTDPGYNLYMDIQQKINLGVMELIRDLDLGFALPSRTIYVAQPTGERETVEPLGAH
ncbi:mechanosensitive ion channel family protein [Paraburkholderia heleia]|uniref:mechanosensitive ion channel family protein n=1 Tax=Paraburkholderia heleia TaxID=634127 RepID=UPI0005A9215C|nr:mechanosensitive ion channel family protein [Paraburkholderia heleia]